MLCAWMLSSCGSSTRITGSWVSPEAKNLQTSGNRSVFIASMSRNLEVRTKLENALAAEAVARNIKAVKSIEYLSPDFFQKMPSEQQLMNRIGEAGVNTILTVALIDTKNEQRYVRGNTTYAPAPAYRWYGRFYSYYSYWYPIQEPGYYVTDKTYYLETNLYDAKSNELLWSAQSETVNPGGIDNFVRDYPKKLVAQMVKDGLLSQ